MLVLLCAAGAVLGRIQTSARTGGAVDFPSRMVRSSVSPLSNGLTAVADGVSDFTAGVFRAGALTRENRRLHDLAQAAALYDSRVDLLIGENDRLRRLLSIPKIPGRQRVAASVIGYAPLENRITLNVGSAQGIRAEQPVVTSEGLVGRVQTVEAGKCQVLLISSPRLRIGAMVQRDPPPVGLAIGESPRVVLLDYLDMRATVQVGDEVVTSGYSDRVPPGIPIGKIAQISDDPETGSRRCQVFPHVVLGELRAVFVLK